VQYHTGQNNQHATSSEHPLSGGMLNNNAYQQSLQNALNSNKHRINVAANKNEKD
jgi:hypothetical protein